MHMKLSAKKIEKLNEVANRFERTGCMWETGSYLNTITEALAKVLKNNNVCINVPYNTFNCRGTAIDINRDVKGLMPFSRVPKKENECTTLFYGNTPINNGNYIPFLSDTDTYHIKRMEINEDVVNIWLEKGNSYRTFM